MIAPVSGDGSRGDAATGRPRRAGRLGCDGPELSALGFGTWVTGGAWRFGWGPVDDDESVAAIRHAVERGVNWIDTAAAYGLGHAEEVVGRAVEPYRAGEDVLVFTKCGRSWEEHADGTRISYDLRPDSIREQCEASLRRLGLERIDLYQFHWPDIATGTPVEESWAAMARLVDEGKVRLIGVSNFSVELLARCEAIRHVDSLQPPLSLLNRHARTDLIPWCRANGTGVIAYSPMASGLLSGSFSRGRLEQLAPDDFRHAAAPFQEPKLSQNLALVERLGPVAARLGTTVPALAIGWALAVPGVTGAIVGARRPAQVDGWIDAAGLVLDQETLGELERAVEETGAGVDTPPTPPPRS
jgi:aryl-alcohol dehydrogenase-like predicted oxidoreductase